MIVILGGTGYIGSAFLRELHRRGIEHRSLSRTESNYTNPRRLEAFLRTSNPHFVINCAGYTGKPNVDACEQDKLHCLDANAVLPGTIDQVCRLLDLPWGHVSSGCIFSGRRTDGKGFSETDVPNFSFRHGPCSFYSGTKALGEEVLGYDESPRDNGTIAWESSNQSSAYIWRMRIPFDHHEHSRNYLTKITRYPLLLEAENSITNLDEFVRSCLTCIDNSLPFGIYNVTNPGSITTHRIVELIQEHNLELKKGGISSPFPDKYRFFENENVFMQQAGRTPRSHCVLDSSKLRCHGIVMRPVEQAIRDSLKQWTSH